jgi:PAS domain S-box-containing protein
MATSCDRSTLQGAFTERDGHLRMYVELAPVPVAMLDADMRYVAASQRWRDIYQLGGQPLVGRSHYEIFPEIPEAWKELHRRCLAGESLREENDRFVRSDGSVQWLRWEMRPWTRPNGRIAGLMIFFEDITEHVMARLANEQLVLAAASANAASRAKDAFLAAMSHELRTPLNAIIGFTTLLLDGVPGEINDEQRKQLAIVRDAGDRLLDIVVRILDVAEAASHESGTIRPANDANSRDPRNDPVDLSCCRIWTT